MENFSRWDAQNAVRFFMMCYHEGACDACNQNDDAYCSEYLENHRQEPYLGIISRDDMTEQEFMFNLMIYCRKYRMFVFGQKFIGKIIGPGLRPFFYVAQMFYLEGVSDYLSYPNYLRMEKFEDVYNCFWKVDNHHQFMDNNDVIDMIQRFCYDIRVQLETKGNNVGPEMVNRITLETFARAMWTLTQPLKALGGNRLVKYKMNENIVEPDAQNGDKK